MTELDPLQSINTNDLLCWAEFSIFCWSPTVWYKLNQIGILLSILTPGALFIVYRKLKYVRWQSLISSNKLPINNSHKIKQCDAIIFTTSRAETILWTIEQLNPKAIGLITTSQSSHAVEQVKDAAIKQGFKIDGIRQISDAESVNETRNVAAELIKTLIQKDYKHLYVDITGGTKSMSIGAYIAAQQQRKTPIKTSAPYNESLKKIDKALATIRLI